jgi:uncharacterized protein (TIGR02145 family)/prepilin-type N-terminal cleavage/methylation domain-containing protein
MRVSISNKYSGFTRLNFTPKNYGGFTIVELLVVIVIIGILATLTIVSYTGISNKASVSSLQSDLSNSLKRLKMYQIEYDSFPQAMTSIDGNVTFCPTGTNPDSKYCIKPSSGNTFVYSPSSSTYSSFILDIIDTANSTKYRITNDSTSVSAMPTDTVTVGTQTWMKYNSDVGIMVTGATAQTNNSVLEKYCYDDNTANCTIYGGLYQWAEAVQYQNGATNTTSPSPAFSANVQGICPVGFHIPSDNDLKILEMQLGMTQETADIAGWRGTDQGTQLKTGNPPGLYVLLAGNRLPPSNTFYGLSIGATLSSSSESSATSAWRRYMGRALATVFRNSVDKANGFPVHCLGN